MNEGGTVTAVFWSVSLGRSCVRGMVRVTAVWGCHHRGCQESWVSDIENHNNYLILVFGVKSIYYFIILLNTFLCKISIFF